MKYIKINGIYSNGKKAKVSNEDFKTLNAYRWHATEKGYARGVKAVDGKYVKVYMHRELTGARTGQVVDHINGNRLDNRRENLRICSAGANASNRKPLKRRGLKYKGVYRAGAKFRALITIDGLTMHLGTFSYAHEAAKAYNAAAVEAFGTFAGLNKIKEAELTYEKVKNIMAAFNRDEVAPTKPGDGFVVFGIGEYLEELENEHKQGETLI